MATIKFLLQGKSEPTPIYLRLSLGREMTLKRKTGLYINPKDWNTKKGLPIQNNSTNKNLTTDLLELSTEIIKNLNDANTDGATIDGYWLEHCIDLHFERITEHNQSELVTDAIQDVIDNADVRKNGKGGVGLSKSRINSYKSLKRIFTEYQENKKYKVKDVDVRFAKDFLKYLLNKKNYQKSYALKKIADLKTVCYDAETNGIEINPQLKKIDSAKPKNENIIFLNPQELEKIESTNLISDALQNARKWLLLGCNIGQRGGDLLNLNENNFVMRNGLNVIEIKQQKTGKNVTIPVLEKTNEILETGLPYKISIQKFNEHIKSICELAKINEVITTSKITMVDEDGKPIKQDAKGNYLIKGVKRKIEGTYPKFELLGSHVCRRSFASNLYGKLPTALIMQITSHSTEKMLLNYIGKNSLDYAQQIADYYTLEAQKKKKEPQLTIVKKSSNS